MRHSNKQDETAGNSSLVLSSLPDESGTYSLTTEGIHVSVIPAHVERSSTPDNSRFAFTYVVTIKNLNSETVQLLERHWIIYSGGKPTAEIVGPGVVGVEPVLESGSSFEYSSNIVINDPIGTMEGSYTFRSENGRYFQAIIPKFDLSYPLILH